MKAASILQKMAPALPSKSCFLLIAILFVFLLVSCKRQENQEPAQSWPQVEPQEETKPAPPPAPKITEDIYVDITARAALIFDRYKEDLDEAHRQMDLVYQKYGITFTDYDRYRRNLTTDQKRRLEKLVQEQIQKVYKEYFEDLK
ncbi:MAG: hypothetical protein HPY46_06310 [Candidatus Aminicenantes bacterium]|uniref:Lipoprotein n=1 Tax=Candidatus Saccharicenans subterraneus TaxID=2508984 RepID=A0A3E2BMM3_9BACT|nr:hypothetical protein [Candidatus Aminicenantes bacterium]RFT16010.1 MAG: hypothetical protein OP8BY_2016 [Candidatus Saccharicenans subterraneum]